MSLRIVDPPAGTVRHIAQRVAGMVAGGGLGSRRVLDATGPMQLAAPHPVFNLHLRSVRAGGNFERAVLTGWRFFLVTGGEVAGMVEASATYREEKPRFARVSYGRMTRCASDNLASAEADDAVQKGDFVLGMLRLPAVHVHALWFRDAYAVGRRDLFMPLEPSHSAVTPGRVLRAEEFMGQLVNVARSLPRSR
jgi:hypothetical protein